MQPEVHLRVPAPRETEYSALVASADRGPMRAMSHISARTSSRLLGPSCRAFFSTKNGLAKPNIAIAGASGAVGIEMLKTIEKRDFPFNEVRLAGTAPHCPAVCARERLRKPPAGGVVADA